jgi:hypothetical protein
LVIYFKGKSIGYSKLSDISSRKLINICYLYSNRKIVKATFTIVNITSFTLAGSYVAPRDKKKEMTDTASGWGEELPSANYREDSRMIRRVSSNGGKTSVSDPFSTSGSSPSLISK